MKLTVKTLLLAYLFALTLQVHADFDEVVVTIYFSGTNLTGAMWDADDSAFERSETVASLHHAQINQEGHHKGLVNGIVQSLFNDTFVPNWNAQLNAAYSIFDDRPACTGECVILNLVGFSRGGISTMHVAHEFYETESSLKKINIIAFDPVPGDRLVDSGRFILPPIAEYIGFYADDERSLGFAPIVPSRAQTSQPVDFFLVPGAHETVVGSVYRNGHRDSNGTSVSRLDPLPRTLRFVATELLGSQSWGNVRFNPDGNGSVPMDWYEG